MKMIINPKYFRYYAMNNYMALEEESERKNLYRHNMLSRRLAGSNRR